MKKTSGGRRWTGISGVQQLVLSGPLILAAPIAAAAGAITFISPCCLPLVPGYLAYATGMSGSDAQTTRSGRSAPEQTAVADQAGGGGATRPAGPGPDAGRDDAVRAGVLGPVRHLRRGLRDPGRQPAGPPPDRGDPGPRCGHDRARPAVRRAAGPVLVRGPGAAPVDTAPGRAGRGTAAGHHVRPGLDALHRPHAGHRAGPVHDDRDGGPRRVPGLHLRPGPGYSVPDRVGVLPAQ